MPLVQARGDIKGTFKRSVRDAKGGIVKTLQFPAGEVVDVPVEDIPAILNDMYKALNPVRPLYKTETVNGNEVQTLNGKFAVIPKEEFDAMMSDDAEEAEQAAATAPVAPDVADVPLSPQMALAIGSPDQGVSNGPKPVRRSR